MLGREVRDGPQERGGDEVRVVRVAEQLDQDRVAVALKDTEPVTRVDHEACIVRTAPCGLVHPPLRCGGLRGCLVCPSLHGADKPAAAGDERPADDDSGTEHERDRATRPTDRLRDGRHPLIAAQVAHSVVHSRDVVPSLVGIGTSMMERESERYPDTSASSARRDTSSPSRATRATGSDWACGGNTLDREPGLVGAQVVG